MAVEGMVDVEGEAELEMEAAISTVVWVEIEEESEVLCLLEGRKTELVLGEAVAGGLDGRSETVVLKRGKEAPEVALSVVGETDPGEEDDLSGIDVF